jgi:hypothetical protein
MRLAAGTRFGPFEILTALGAGGMGEGLSRARHSAETRGRDNTTAFESEPAFSPDGRWIAYQSLEGGRNEVYVRPFPGPGGKWQISTAGGIYPTWSRTRKELLYLSPDGQIIVASYTTDGDSFKADKPRLWSDARLSPRPRGSSVAFGRSFDLHPDGERLAVALLPQTAAEASRTRLSSSSTSSTSCGGSLRSRNEIADFRLQISDSISDLRLQTSGLRVES